MVDAKDLKSFEFIARAGSIPALGTILRAAKNALRSFSAGGQEILNNKGKM